MRVILAFALLCVPAPLLAEAENGASKYELGVIETRTDWSLSPSVRRDKSQLDLPADNRGRMRPVLTSDEVLPGLTFDVFSVRYGGGWGSGIALGAHLVTVFK